MQCISGGRLCNVIIDGVNLEKLASKIVNMLRIKMEQHSKPYRISWFEKGGKVKVSHRCRVCFLLEERIFWSSLCDVVDIETCHLLLGWPW